MADIDQQKAPDVKSTKEVVAKQKPTAEEVAVAKEELSAAKTDTQKDLNDLKQTIDSVKASKNGLREFRKALDSNKLYKKQVEQVLGAQPWDWRDSAMIIADIQTLQTALKVKSDGALGPKTFKELKAKWEARPPGQDYQTFIDGLIRPKSEKPSVVLSEPQAPTQSPIIWTTETATEGDPKKFLSLKDDKTVMLGNDSFDFELKGDWKTLGIDRDAYKIIDNKSSYDLNIRGKEDNIRIGKLELEKAIHQNEWTVIGTTLPKNGWFGEPITVIINKTEWKKETSKPEDKPVDAVAVTTTVDNKPSGGINVAMWEMALNNQNVIQPTIDTRSSLEQNLNNIPVSSEFQVDQSDAAKLQAQIAIQPVVETLKS